MMEDKRLCYSHLDSIRDTAGKLAGSVTLMEICGGHTNVIMKYGIRKLLPDNVRLISGPGCPVCVASQYDIDCVIELAGRGVPVATYGDMMRVPGSVKSLDGAKAEGGRVFEVYSTTEVIKIREKHPDIIFFGVGFETTSPMSAFLISNDIPVFSVHKLVPPAIKALLAEGAAGITGFIDPGHVSTIIGAKAYRDIKSPQVISGFTPEQVLRSVSILLELIVDCREEVINCYPEAVSEEGNEGALELLASRFKVADSSWRGLGVLPDSGLEVRDEGLDARLIHQDILSGVAEPLKTGCMCGQVLKGLLEPNQCPLYRKECTPTDPKGACMVSEEGGCAIYYRYGK
ncbi:hydrogenase formation protein HypD [Candidatus Altiarchaeota archaeon]